MLLSVICHSCGHRVELADDFARRKVRCPECGVMCEVEGATRTGPRADGPTTEDAEELARQLWSEPDEKPPPKPKPLLPAPPRKRKPTPEEPPPAEEPEPPAPKRETYAVTWTAEDDDPTPY